MLTFDAFGFMCFGLANYASFGNFWIWEWEWEWGWEFDPFFWDVAIQENTLWQCLPLPLPMRYYRVYSPFVFYIMIRLLAQHDTRNSDDSDLIPITDLTKSSDAEWQRCATLRFLSNCFKICRKDLCAQNACVADSWIGTNVPQI